MSRLVGNAVFMPPRNKVQVVVFEGSSTTLSREGTDASIDEVAESVGRIWRRASSTADRMSYELAFADVLLVYAQPRLEADTALAVGRMWRVALAGFLARGGVVVVAVGPGSSGDSFGILEGAGLVDGSATRTDVTGAILHIERASDAVAVGMPLTYRAEPTTVRLDLSLEGAVVSDGLGPVVLHRVVAP